MFKKLLSNLPFNPSLIGQLSFYTKRLHQESRVRAIGLVLLVLTMLIQLFAVVSPPQPTLAVSDNDLIKGGFTSQTQAVNTCNGNTGNYKTIMSHFGVSCSDIARASTTTIHSTDYGRQLYSMGRIPYGKAGETTVNIGSINYYMRYLWSWDTHGSASSYKTLVGKNSKGVTFLILYGCGNLVIIGPPKAPPAPKDVCSNIAGIQTDKKQCDICKNVKGIQTNKKQCDVCPKIPGNQTSKSQCLPCQKSQGESDGIACVVLSKAASNLTLGIQNANDTTAKPGNQIVYNLNAANTGKTGVAFIVQENLADVLEYADVTDTHGGILNADTKVISWPPVVIPSKQAISRQVTIKVKDPLPQTPRSTSNPGSYDLLMTNVYGDTINIKLPKSPIKRTEEVAKSLPNTGPGAVIIIAFSVTALAGYFFARSRLMAKEMDIAKVDFTSGGDS